MAVVHGGERLLPKNVNAGFKALANEISDWERQDANAGRGVRTEHDDNSDLLERMADGIDRMVNEPTPVKLHNTDELKAAFVAGAYAAQDSDLGASITDKQFSEGIRYFMEMQ
jgi:hypothetical protein